MRAVEIPSGSQGEERDVDVGAPGRGAGLMLERASCPGGAVPPPVLASMGPASQPAADVERLVLACLDTPMLVIDANRRLLFRNPAAARVLRASFGFAEQRGRLTLGPRHDAALQRILGELALLAGHPAGTVPRGLQIGRSGRGRSWMVLVRKLETADTAFLLWLIGRKRPRVIPTRAVQELFDLTRKEVAVVGELFACGTVERTAARLSVSPETVRSHLKRVFQKCGVHSKHDLFALLHSAANFG